MSWHPVPFVVRGWRGSHVPCWLLTSHSARVTYVTQPVLHYNTAVLLGDTSNFEWYELHITSGFNVTPDCTTASAICVQYKLLPPPTHCLLKTPSVAHRVKTFYKVKPQTLSFHIAKIYYRGSGKSLAPPGRKQATATKLYCKPLKINSEGCPSNQVSAAAMTSASDENLRPFNCFFYLFGSG